MNHWCCSIAAAAVAVAGVVLVGWCSTMCSVLRSLPLHFTSLSLSIFPDSHWVSSVTRISRAALVAARHDCRRPRTVRRCGPLSIRTHHDFCHHVMCLFDTWFLWETERSGVSVTNWQCSGGWGGMWSCVQIMSCHFGQERFCAQFLKDLPPTQRCVGSVYFDVGAVGSASVQQL